MNMKSETDDKETLLPVTNYKTIEGNHDRSEPFDIEGSYMDTQERPLPIPSFILDQKTIYEKSKCYQFIFCCCAKKYRENLISNLKNRELRVYYKIKSLAIQLFDETNTHHKESLKFLYTICIKKESNGNYKTIEWKKVGFQTDNPTTDFRGSGYISLLFLIYFVKQYESEYNEMINFEYFLFAIAAIRIVFMFKNFAHLVESDRDMEILLKTHKIKLMTIKQFKTFNRYQLANENYIYELLAKCMIQVKLEYKRQYNSDKKEKNFLLIEPIIQKAFDIVYDELE